MSLEPGKGATLMATPIDTTKEVKAAKPYASNKNWDQIGNDI